MLCEKCGTENPEGSRYCKECRAPLAEGVPPPQRLTEITEETKPTFMIRLLSTAWSRKGPILIAFFLVLMMSMIFAPWAFIKFDVLGLSLVSRNFNGWDILVPRILFYLSLIPLLFALLMVAGIGTRRRVMETHICTFFGGVMFTFWVLIFALTMVLGWAFKQVHVVQVNMAGGQVATIVLLIGFIIGIIVTTYDRGRYLAAAGKGG